MSLAQLLELAKLGAIGVAVVEAFAIGVLWRTLVRVQAERVEELRSALEAVSANNAALDRVEAQLDAASIRPRRGK